MKILYLIRHAKSSWADATLSDFERPLNQRGKRDAQEMGKSLATQKIVVDYLLSSPAKRAKKTIQKIAKKILFPIEKIVFEPDIYEANISDIFTLINDLPNKANSAMLVGHNPTLTDAINLLLPDFKLDNLPTCGVVALQFDCQRWAEVEENTGKFLFLQSPRNYHAPESTIGLSKGLELS